MTFEEKVLRYGIMDMHYNMVMAGKYREAKKVLECLRHGSITRGYTNADYTAERALRRAGCYAVRENGKVKIYLKPTR